MKKMYSTVRRITLSDLVGLDPITIFIENFGERRGAITIKCWNEVWSHYWGSMPEDFVETFFRSCDTAYLADKLGCVEERIFDPDAIRAIAERHNIEYYRDDPWNDYDLMRTLFGPDMAEWDDAIPKKANPKHRYLCKVIEAVKEGLEQ